ncbi:polyprenol phosphomannose-dependent alpha 1,6 mannosyltransferase MptB [Sinomonas halotolerans]|uniref:Polyprenol phosphomannose-dependent alpha 1,6 mannosyltransferase MptB n=1 Tax=Sinomonas halotolerans TaxID=1644133 RepID=A0ABU9WZT8_9MICC
MTLPSHPVRRTRVENGGQAVEDPRWPLLAGFAGSVAMLIGSFGVGWLAPASELRRYPFFIWMRTEVIGVVLSIILLAVGGMLLVRSWLRLGQKVREWGPEARAATLKALALWGGPMLFAVPLFSRDVYSYIGQGRLMLEGFNPYEDGISTLSNYYQLGADRMWSEAPTPYGQFYLWIEQFVVWATGVHPEASVFLFRLVCVAGVGLVVVYVPRLAALHGVDPHRALWLTVANPLFLTNFIAAVHNDALMVGLAVAGVYYVAARRPLLGIVLVTLSVSVKPITALLLPFVALMWAGRRAGWPRKAGYLALTAALSLGLLYVLSLPNGFGFGWINGLAAPGSVWIWYAPVGMLGMMASSIGAAMGLGWLELDRAVFAIGRVASLAIVAWLALRGSHDRLVRRMTLAFAAVVLLAPMIQAWYIVWLIPFFAVTGIRNDWQVKSLYFVVSFFMVYGISDQLDVFPYLQEGDNQLALALARNAAALIALLFGLYLIFIDPKTRRLFRPGARSLLARR